MHVNCYIKVYMSYQAIGKLMLLMGNNRKCPVSPPPKAIIEHFVNSTVYLSHPSNGITLNSLRAIEINPNLTNYFVRNNLMNTNLIRSYKYNGRTQAIITLSSIGYRYKYNCLYFWASPLKL